MSSSRKESRMDDEHAVFSSPGSPAASPKPGLPVPSVARPRHSGGGGTAGSNNTSSTAGYAGGYAIRHSLTQLSALSASGAAASCDSPASRGSSGGRSMQASRRASVTERPSQQQPQHHHRTASHGVVDISAHSSTSPSDKPEKARAFYSKMMSYGRHAPGPAATAAGQPPQQQSQQLASESSVPELVLVGGDHPHATECGAEKLPAPFQLGPTSPAAVAAALLGDAAAAAAAVGMHASLDNDAAAAAARLVAALTSSRGEKASSTAAATAENHAPTAVDSLTAALSAAGRSCQQNRNERFSPGGASFKDSGSINILAAVPSSSISSTGAAGEVSGSKVDSKPSTPTERAKALARAALDALQPHLRKSKKAAEEPQVDENVSNVGSFKRQRKKAAALAAKKAEAAAAAALQHHLAAAVADDAAVPTRTQESTQEASIENAAIFAGSLPLLAASEGAASAAASQDPTVASAAGKLAGAAASHTPAVEAVAVTVSSLLAAVGNTVTACEGARVAAAAGESPRQPTCPVITPRGHSKQGATTSSPARSPLATPRTKRSEKQMLGGVVEPLTELAAAAFSVGGDMEDTKRAVSLKLSELGEYFRTPAVEGNAGTAPTAAVEKKDAAAATASEAGATEGAAVAAAAEQGGYVSAVPELLSDATASNFNSCDGRGGRSVACSVAGTRSVTSSAGGSAGSMAGSGDYRYSELIFRLQQFLPALKAVDASNCNSFEATWELIKVCVADVQQHLDKQPHQWQQQLDEQREQGQNAPTLDTSLGDDVLLVCMSELTALVNTAKLAQLQAVKLEVLDAEVAQLQKLLVRVGQDIKAGAQQQQLRDLFYTFPSFARRQVMEQSTGSSSSSNSSEPSSPAISATAAAASAATSAPGPKPLVQTLGLALLNHSQYPPSSGDGSRRSNGLDTGGSTWSQGWSVTSCDGSDKTPGNSSGGGSTSSAAAAAEGHWTSPMRGSLLSGTAPAKRTTGGRVAVGASPCGSEGEVGREEGAASPPPPPYKELTAEESKQLASLYRVAADKPQRIFYKELKLGHHKTSAGGNSRYSASISPSTSPRCHAAAARSPAATAGGPAAAAASWRRVVSPEPSAAIPAAAIHNTEAQQQQRQQEQQEPADSPVEWKSSSGTNPICHSANATGTMGTFTSNAVPCSTGHAHIGSGGSGSAVHSSWPGVPKGFRVLRAIPEAHKTPQAGSSQGGLCSPPRFRDDSPRQSRSHSTPPGMLASSDSPMYQRGQPGRSPDRFASGRQSRRVGSPLRHSLAQTQFREQHHPQQQHQQPGELLLSWSYPRGRDPRLRASREGSLALGPCSATASPMPLADSYVRARSTSPSIGMHYLERPSSGASLKSRGAAASVRASYCSSVATGGCRGNGPFSSMAASAPGSPTKGPAVPVVAEDYRFSEAKRAFLHQHSCAVAAEGLSPTKACGDDNMGGAKLAARLSPIKDADSNQIDAAMKRLVATLQDHDVNLGLVRLGPCLYSAAGRKLRIRMLNGNLLVRTGGGHEGLLDALGKLPLSAIDSNSSSRNSSDASLSGKRSNSSHQDDSADDSCYTNLAVEAAVAAAAVAAADSSSSSSCCSSTSVEQQPAAVAQTGVMTSGDDAVAVIRIGDRSGLAVQCGAAESLACLGDAALVAVVEGAADPELKGATNSSISGMLHNTQQPARPAAVQ